MVARRGPTIRQFKKTFELALATGDSELLNSTADHLQFYRLGEDKFPENILSLILNIITRVDFLEMNGSWPMLTLFSFDIEAMSDAQQERIFAVMEEIFPRFRDWMGWFIVCELLGRDFGNQRALDLLSRLATVAAEGPRSFVPHGVEHIISGSSDPALVRAGIEILLKLHKDPSQEVAGKACESIEALSLAGVDIPKQRIASSS